MSQSRRTPTLLALAALLALGCPKDDRAKIGVILPLTGPVATYGEAVRRGVELAFEEAKARPELSQYQLELVVVDSGGDPERAAQQLDELYAGGAIAVVGGVTSNEALAMVEVADEWDRILVSPTASSPDLTGVSKNFFRVFPSDFVEGTQMGRFAADTLKLENAVILAAESSYGRGIQGVFKGEFERRGGEVLEVVEYPPNTQEFSGLAERVVTLGARAVYIAAYWDDTVKIINGLDRAGFEGTVLTTAAFATPQAVAAAGENAEGVFFTQTIFDLNSPADPIRGFVERFRQKHGEDPDLYAAHGYDAMRLLLEALAAEGTLPSNLWKGIRAIRSFPGVTGALQFDEKGDVTKYPRVYVIRDGSPVNYDKWREDVRQAFQERLQALERQQRRLKSQAGEE